MNVGTYEDYLRMDLKKGITHYKLCQELESVVDFELASWLNNGINDLFTVPHNLLYNEIMSMNGMAYGGACWGTGSYGDDPETILPPPRWQKERGACLWNNMI
jgi:hypothetical protein